MLLLAAVNSETQSRGVYADLIRAELAEAVSNAKEKKALSIYAHTQSPRIEAGIVSGLNARIKEGEIVGFTLTRVKKPFSDGRMQTKEKPKPCRIKEIDEAYSELDYEKGDAFSLTFTLQFSENKVP